MEDIDGIGYRKVERSGLTRSELHRGPGSPPPPARDLFAPGSVQDEEKNRSTMLIQPRMSPPLCLLFRHLVMETISGAIAGGHCQGDEKRAEQQDLQVLTSR